MTTCIAQHQGNNWTAYNGDSVEMIRAIPENSIDYIIFSPPFTSLYTYSASERDMGNTRSHHDFWQHYSFLSKELYRVLKPGRLMSVHSMLFPLTKQHDGVIGLYDFRGDIVRLHCDDQFIFHSEVVIWKDPVTAMQRTKSIGLLHKQMVKDSAISRQGVPDYLSTFRKPGVNEEPIHGRFEEYIGLPETEPVAQDEDRYSIEVWQRYASPVWMDINPSDTLQYTSCRADEDERHICPLQLQVIKRGIALWTNEGDTVLTPFGGIGSEAYCAVEMKRKAVLMELKQEYYDQAVKNLEYIEFQSAQPTLFDLLAAS
jgi:DNA modification methylase